VSAKPEGDRDVIPRWRDPRRTAAQGELAPLHIAEGKPLDQTGRLEREHDWLGHKTLGFALDLVGTAIVVGVSPVAQEAAQFVLDARGPSEIARVLARQVAGNLESNDVSAPLGDPTKYEVGRQIHDFRVRLRSDPRNALAWTEMARYYTILGLRDKARGAMRVALGLAPDHRYVLRVAARLAVHHGKFEEAHSIVARASRTPTDPWLVAAELATSGPAEVRPRLTKHAKRMLELGEFSPRSTSELASALGTLELRAGSDRKARRLIESSLEEPNDNAIAQGEWISGVLSSIEIDANLLDESAEARAIRHGAAMDSEPALEAAWEWHHDQPFASGPGELGSYHASLSGMYAEGVAIAKAARIANPNEFLLDNNLAFCLLNLDRVDEAAEILNSIDRSELSERQRATFLATYGLLEFRSGNPDSGRLFYRESIRQDRDPHHRAIATIMLASEEIRLRSEYASRLVQEAITAGKQFETDDIKLWLKRLPKTT